MKPEEIKRASRLLENVLVLEAGIRNAKKGDVSVDNYLSVGGMKINIKPEVAQDAAERIIESHKLELEKLGVDL